MLAVGGAQALYVSRLAFFGEGALRRFLYGPMLKQRKAMTELWTGGGPWWARSFYAVAYPAIAGLVRRRYQTDDAQAVAAAKHELVAALDQLDALLSQQPYLGGSAPNRLDITAAALLAPLCRPPEHRVKWPDVPAELDDFETTLRQHPTYQHVGRMYRAHRRRMS